MKQFILNKEQCGLRADSPSAACKQTGVNIVRLEGNDYHYLVNVRRLATGEFFPALLPNGEETLVQILSVDNNVLTGKCNAPENFAHGQGDILPPIILFQAMPKSDKMDLIVRQAVEGGITEIVPFISEFSAAKVSGKMRMNSQQMNSRRINSQQVNSKRINSQGQKFLRWERIIKEARQQSGSKITTTLHQPLTKNELFEYWNKLREKDELNSLGLIFHHQKGLEQESLHGYLNSVPSIITMVIGPEGGFSDKEVSLFLENGFKVLTIGDTVLRTETAALYCAAAIRILLLEKDSWKLKQTKPGSE